MTGKSSRWAMSLALVALFQVPTQRTSAEEGEKAKVGDRVRVSGRLAVSRPITGTLRKIEHESITITPEGAAVGEMDVRVQHIQSSELYIGSCRGGRFIEAAAATSAEPEGPVDHSFHRSDAKENPPHSTTDAAQAEEALMPSRPAYAATQNTGASYTDSGSPQPTIGSYVRGLAGSRFEGRIVEIRPDAYALDTSNGRVSLPRDLVTRLEVKSGSKRRVLAGLLAGTAAGLAVGIALDRADCGTTTRCSYYTERSALIGAGGGAILGALFKRATWTSVIPSKP